MKLKLWVAIIAVILISVVLVSTAVYFNVFSQPEIQAEATQNITLTISSMGTGTAYEDDFMQFIEDKFNVDITIVDPNAAAWRDSLQKQRTIGNLPEVFLSDMFGYGIYDEWVNSGDIMAIDPDETTYPYLYEYMNDGYVRQFANENGEIFGIPRIGFSDENNYQPARCIIIREDIMEDMGFTMPQSSEEFEALLYEFVHVYYPEKTGEKGIGLLVENLNKMEAIFLGDYPELSNLERGWVEQDGQIIPVYASENMGAGLDYAQHLYREQLLDELFYQRPVSDVYKLFIEGKSIAVAIPIELVIENWLKMGGSGSISDKVEVMRPWPSADGEIYRFTTTSHWSEVYINNDINTETKDKIMQILDYTISPQFIEDIQSFSGNDNPSIHFFGNLLVYGTNFTVENHNLYPELYDEALLQELARELEWYNTNAKVIPYYMSANYIDYNGKDNLPSNQKIHDLFSKAILSEQTASQVWQEQLQELYAEHNLQLAIDNVTEKLG